MDRIVEYRINDEDCGKQIVKFLREKGFSRNILISMKEDTGAILLNGERAGGRAELRVGDVLHIRVADPRPENRDSSPEIKSPPPAYRIPSPSILYEDKDLIILNKPAGTPVHPSAGNHGNTLADIMEAYFSAQNLYCPFRCINRLDRDTSGALILAKNPLSAAILSAQMKQRKIRRTYLAIVSGRTPEKGTINAPIAREPGSALKRCVDFINGETAVTYYERLAERDGFSLLEIHLETGRTHQIRVHMGYLGHPLPGDFLYCPDYTRFARQPLHSLQLEFTHPLTGEPLRFLAPVPRDMAETFSGFSRK